MLLTLLTLIAFFTCSTFSVHVNVLMTSDKHTNLVRSIENMCCNRLKWSVFVDVGDCTHNVGSHPLVKGYSMDEMTIILQTDGDIEFDDLPSYAKRCKTLVIVNPDSVEESIRLVRPLITPSIHLFPVDVTNPPFSNSDDFKFFNDVLASSILYCLLD